MQPQTTAYPSACSASTDGDAHLLPRPSDTGASTSEWAADEESASAAAGQQRRAVSGGELFESVAAAAADIGLADASVTDYSNDVLVVDDDEEISYFVKFMFERSGHSVAVADDGLAALEYIDKKLPTCLVVLDVVLPYLDGYQIISTLRAHRNWCGTPIIILSSLSGEDHVVRALNAGALDYIVKPFKPTELVVRLRRFLPPPEFGDA